MKFGKRIPVVVNILTLLPSRTMLPIGPSKIAHCGSQRQTDMRNWLTHVTSYGLRAKSDEMNSISIEY